MGEFILTLLHAVTNTHILHFRASTNAEHLQLGEFYPALSDLVDTLAGLRRWCSRHSLSGLINR